MTTRSPRLSAEMVFKIREYAKTNSIKATSIHFKLPLGRVSKVVNASNYAGLQQRPLEAERPKRPNLSDHEWSLEVEAIKRPLLDKINLLEERTTILESRKMPDINELVAFKARVNGELEMFKDEIEREFRNKMRMLKPILDRLE
jgi:hypothetical protein